MPPLASEIQIWAFHWARNAHATGDLWQLLSPAEQQQVAQKQRAADRARAIASRGVLRILLARALGCPPTALAFACGAHGKPFLVTDGAPGAAFNVSHSGDWVLVALGSAHVQLGVDIEQQRPIDEWRDIARHYFHAQECAALTTPDTAAPLPRFFDCWTRKEAVVKALGIGIAMDLKSFCVPTAPLPGHAAVPLRLPPPHQHLACSLYGGLLDTPKMPETLGYSSALALVAPANAGVLALRVAQLVL